MTTTDKMTVKLYSLLLFIAMGSSLQPAFAQSSSPKINPIDTAIIEQVTGIKGKANNGEYKITIPQNDLSIMVDSFKIIPAMGLGTWIAFTPLPGGAMIMGDIILTETDLKPVQQEVIKQGRPLLPFTTILCATIRMLCTCI